MKTFLLLGALALAPSFALAAPPVIDGNLDDLFQFAQDLGSAHTGYGVVIVDVPNVNNEPQPEAIYSDPKFIPCPTVNGSPPPLGSHWVNGTEIFYHSLAYEPGSNTLYLGLRSEGVIGDVDGNGDPDGSGGGACNPQDNIEDTNGISGNELYNFRFDLNCDGIADATIKIQDNSIVGTGLLAGVTGTFAYHANAGVGASGHDLEIALNLPAPLPGAFTYLGVQTNAFDGLTEDSSAGAPFVPNPAIDLTAGPDIRVCPGESGRVTIQVNNSGQAPLVVNLHDTLAPGWSYAGGLSTNCGTGEPTIEGSVLTFATFNLAPGASCSVAFDVLSDVNCAGEGQNVVDVDGTFTSPCISEFPGAMTVTDQASSALACDPTQCAPEGTCRLTGGGCMNDDPDTGKRGHKQSTFGGNSSPLHEGGGPSGNSWEHILRDGRETLFNWHSWDAHVIGCSVVGVGPCHPSAVNTRADFVGTGRYSIGSGGREEDGNMVAYIIDHKEGSCNKGTRDEYFITVRKGLEIGQGEIVFDRGGFIDCGNLQIHETPARLFGNGMELPGNAPAVALTDRAYPNPFSGTTRFAYRVAEGGSAVDVGVYNVAGRLVKTLASGSKTAGTYTVTWDGSDDTGVRMAPGVYFLKSKVGGEQVVNRLIHVAN